ncbi:conjugative transposon protein TraM [Flavobacterium sp. GT3P67]|uniref:conjugative transposon protein TraM n=1 Tax=Flavobacterium sp. GT3P67 TaxID=2541722 RepID=UPI0010508DA5|nr:conjugative transposon protein TraM [Flavobacterium sp. GT3P67]TDE52681.1 conjugative transposon protein TraM [Flavobacterium sp. GT3P67]
MEAKMKSAKMLRQRKILLVMPLLVLPFITIIFWVCGGGKMDAANSVAVEKEGFNIKLPDANLKEGLNLDKMHYYDQATLDSIKLDELISKDPNYLSGDFPMDSTKERGTTNNRNRLEKGGKGLNSLMYRDPNEAKVHEKLEALQRVINTPVTASRTGRNYANSNGSVLHSEEVIKLEEMMQSMNTQNNEPDPELKQLSGMLESILDIQHPNRVQDKLRKASQAQRGQVFSIAATSEENHISSLNTKLRNQADSDEWSKGNSFYSLEEPASTDFLKNAIAAVIHNTQTIVNGSTVKLRLVGAVFINGVQIPKNTFLFGLASLKGERLLVKINSIQYNNSLFPVDLNVFDLDGISGIYIPGAINRDVAKATADRSVQTLGVASLDDSWGAQAAGVGIEAAKTLLSKKAKLIKVVVKAGYQVLLHDEQQKQNNSNQN